MPFRKEVVYLSFVNVMMNLHFCFLYGAYVSNKPPTTKERILTFQ